MGITTTTHGSASQYVIITTLSGINNYVLCLVCLCLLVISFRLWVFVVMLGLSC